MDTSSVVFTVIFLIILLWIILGLRGQQRKKDKLLALEQEYLPALDPLLKLAFSYSPCSSDLDRCISRENALAEEHSPVSKDTVILFDIIHLIRSVALVKDRIWLSDGELLQVFCRKRSIRQFEDSNAYGLMRGIEDYRPDGELLLTVVFLVKQESPHVEQLLEAFLEIGSFLCRGNERREEGFSQFKEKHRAFLGLTASPKEHERRVKEASGRVAETLEELSTFMEAELLSREDPRRKLLEVSADARPEEIKSAYHDKVRLWHPDKLQDMAPELQEAATAHLAKLNEAYESLLSELA